MSKSMTAPCGATVTAEDTWELGVAYDQHVTSCPACKAHSSLEAALLLTAGGCTACGKSTDECRCGLVGETSAAGSGVTR